MKRLPRFTCVTWEWWDHGAVPREGGARPSSMSHVYPLQYISTILATWTIESIDFVLKLEKKNKVKSSKLPNLGLNRKKQEKVPLPPHTWLKSFWASSKLQKHVVPMPFSTPDYIISLVSARVPWEESVLSELETCFVYVRKQTTVPVPFSEFERFHIYNGWIRGWVSLKSSYVFIHKTFE